MKRSATSPVSTGIFVTGIAMFNFLYCFSSGFVFEKKQPLAAKVTFFRDNPPLFSEIVAFHARNLTFPPSFSNLLNGMTYGLPSYVSSRPLRPQSLAKLQNCCRMP